MARATSPMPGPESLATTTMPRLSPSRASARTISPRIAYSTMFLAISEMAVATMVRSLPENPASAANSRPRWRARRMSCSEPIWSRLSSSIAHPPSAPVQDGQPLIEVQAGGDPVEPQSQLDHGESDLWLETHDHGIRTAKPAHLRDVEQGPDGERVHHVGRGHVHDDPLRPQLPHLPCEVVLQPGQVGVCERGLD